MPLTGVAGDHSALPMGIIMVLCYALSLVVFRLMIWPEHKK